MHRAFLFLAAVISLQLVGCARESLKHRDAILAAYTPASPMGWQYLKARPLHMAHPKREPLPMFATRVVPPGEQQLRLRHLQSYAIRKALTRPHR